MASMDLSMCTEGQTDKLKLMSTLLQKILGTENDIIDNILKPVGYKNIPSCHPL